MKIIEVKGIGEKTEKLFHKLGIYSTDELLEFYPRNYDSYNVPTTVRELDNEGIAAFLCVITSSPVIRQAKKLSILMMNAKDKNGDTITLKWYNMPFLKGRFRIGMHFVFRGKVARNSFYRQNGNNGEITLEQPEIFGLEEYEKKQGTLLPVYRLTEGLSNKIVTKSVKQVLENCFETCEFLPEQILQKYELLSYEEAVKKIHFPANTLEMERARKRLAFNEFFLFIMALRRFKKEIGRAHV